MEYRFSNAMLGLIEGIYLVALIASPGRCTFSIDSDQYLRDVEPSTYVIKFWLLNSYSYFCKTVPITPL
jgi:hypothetical protein